MLAVVQFPIADVRGFLPQGSLRQQVPDFAFPRTDFKPNFVRRFGPAVVRRRAVDPAWTDESIYFRANRAIRFPDLHRQRGMPSGPLRPVCAFRRLLVSDGAAVRIEVGLAHAPAPHAEPLANLDASTCLALAHQVLTLSTKVGLPADDSARPLVLQGTHLSRLFCEATTQRSAGAETRVRQARFVEDGRPLLLLQFAPYEQVEFPSAARTVDSAKVRGTRLAFVRLDTPWGIVGTWLLAPGDAGNKDLRALRLCLFRLHAEREALNSVIRQYQLCHINFEPGEDASERLDQYLNDATRFVNRPITYGVSQSALIEAFDAAESMWRPDNWQNLLRRYEGTRRQIGAKFERYQLEQSYLRSQTTVRIGTYVERGQTINDQSIAITNSSISAPVTHTVVAEQIRDSFQAKRTSGSEPTVFVDALTTLRDRADELVAAMGETAVGDPSQIGNFVKVLIAQSREPRPDMDIVNMTMSKLMAEGNVLAQKAATLADKIDLVTSAAKAIVDLMGDREHTGAGRTT